MAGRYSNPCHRRSPVVLLILCGLLISGLACSVEKHYKTLSFFFDGVPNPNAVRHGPRDNTGLVNSTQPALSSSSTHKPYADGRCEACHDPFRPAVIVKSDSSLCLTCHKNVPSGRPIVHGPVAAGACRWCHSPHEAPRPFLLHSAAPAVCLQCHQRADLLAPPAEHRDPAADCLTCHFGHGGTDARFLRPDVAKALSPGAFP
jgi:predicted CXXCH cytochrome family protein